MKVDIMTFVCLAIGFITSWINMIIILNSMEVWSYLTIIFTTLVPAIIIALKNRFWGYGYMLGFAFAGIPFMFVLDLFIGGYTFATSILIFIIMWLVFWKTWRSLSAIRSSKD